MNLLQRPLMTKALGYPLSVGVLHPDELWNHAYYNWETNLQIFALTP